MRTAEQSSGHERMRGRGHESSAIAVSTLLRIGAIILAAVVVSTVAIALTLKFWIEPRHVQSVTRADAVPPAPRLQAAPQQDLATERQQVNQQLHEWRWTDSTHAFAEIPIERAMELYAQQHSAAPASGAAP